MNTRSTRPPEPGRDIPGVLLPPPLIPAAMLIIGAVLQWLAPLVWLSRIPFGWRVDVGLFVALTGVSVIVLAVLALKRRGTNVNPYQPSLAVATGGIFNRARNPIYVGGTGFSVGICIALALDWALLLHPLGILILHRFVVLREERYLKRKFGCAYRDYKAAVRRYV